MKFTELNPMMTGPSGIPGIEDAMSLEFKCPLCGNRIAIHVRLNGQADMTKFIWRLEIPNGSTSWDDVTVTPSISGHHLKRTKDGDIRCPMHVSVTKGQVT